MGRVPLRPVRRVIRPVLINSRLRSAAWGALAAGLAIFPAQAACPLERATYRDVEGTAAIEFTADSETAAVTNGFKMRLDKGVMLDGIVMWTEGVRRPNGMLSYDCPEGDVTGEELAACTVWQGVIYTSDAAGTIALLPPQTAEAPAKLILPDLGPSLRHSAAYGANGLAEVPWDVFAFSSCRE